MLAVLVFQLLNHRRLSQYVCILLSSQQAITEWLSLQRGAAQHVARYGGNVGSESWPFWIDLQACRPLPNPSAF